MGYERRKEILHNVIRGWVNYFKYADAKTSLQAMDEWFADVSARAYGKVGNFHGHACVILSDAEYLSGKHINGEMRVRDIGRWQVVQ